MRVAWAMIRPLWAEYRIYWAETQNQFFKESSGGDD
jgi:hypothetical protein